MSDLNTPEQGVIPEKNFAKTILEASEKSVLEAAQKYWRNSQDPSQPVEIYMRGVTDTYIDTGPVDHPRIAGFMLGIDRTYGPRNYFHGTPGDIDKDHPSIYSNETEKILMDNDLEVRGVLIMREQERPDIISGVDAKQVADELRSLGITNESTYSFTVSDPIEMPVSGASFEYDHVITITNIQTPYKKELPMKITINLGYSDSSSQEANLDAAIETQQKAEEALESGALVSSGFTLPRSNVLTFSATTPDGEQLPVSAESGEHISAAIDIGMTALNVILDVTDKQKSPDNQPYNIPVKNRSVQDMLSLKNDENSEDLRWLSDLYPDE